MIRSRLPVWARFDLCITDVEMPRMDGLHLTSLVHKEAELAGMPVVIFSSLVLGVNHRKWSNLGANYILTTAELPRLVGVAGKLIDGLCVPPNKE
jgi:two-component system chemotaxis response regulator CheV